MSRSSSNPRGFTLVEVLVVLASLGMILWMVGSLFFPMRQAAERQRLQVEARQTGRGALDYVAMLVRGATDMNDVTNPRNPAAILTFLWQGNPSSSTIPTCDGSGGSGCIQVSYNNVTDSTLAAPGTDILTFGRPSAPLRLSPYTWPSNMQNASSPTWWGFSGGCPSDPGNWAAFNQVTGRDPVTGWSQPLMLIDATGQWTFYQITDYKDTQNSASCSVLDASKCTNPTSGQVEPCLQVVANPGNSALNAPGGQRDLTSPVTLIVGLQYVALRVCNGWLEQKVGIFNPATDNNCPALAAGAPFPTFAEMVAASPQPGWSPLLPNVEDLQFAYIYPDGTLPNGPVANGPAGTMTTAAGVPVSGGTPIPALDIRRVIGIRVTITARSSTPVIGGGKTPMPPPAAEDHTPAGAADAYFRFEVSSTCLLRNRDAGF
jgi:prepilin-type N-terminal cleavage/methylation domain-containing protein